jgi:transcriptional regulator with XRE-family HTH domain
MAEAGVSQSLIREELGVSAGTISAWVSDITNRLQRSREAKMWWLRALGWSQEEIAGKFELTHQGVSKALQLTSEMKKVAIDEHSRGRTIDQIAESQSVDPKLVLYLLLDGKDDAERLAELKIGLQPYDTDAFQAGSPGVIVFCEKLPDQEVLSLPPPPCWGLPGGVSRWTKATMAIPASQDRL